MKSNTKVQLDEKAVTALCASAGFTRITKISPMGAGEFNAVYSFDSQGQEYVLKIAPDAGMSVMTYERGMMRSEIFWYEQLQRHTDIPTPEIIHTDFSRSLISSDFFIMRRIDGRQMNEMDFSPEEREAATARLAQMAAQIHRIPYTAYGYPQNGLYESWDLALAGMIGAIIRDAQAMDQSCENGEKALEMIEKHRDLLRGADCRMVNFDLWEANILCGRTDGGIRYTWIDPERGYWGDPIMDFICLQPDQPLAKKHISLEAYNRAAEKPVTVSREEEIRYAFAQVYLGLIMEVERYYRYTPEDEGWERNNRVCEGLFAAAFACLSAC